MFQIVALIVSVRKISDLTTTPPPCFYRDGIYHKATVNRSKVH